MLVSLTNLKKITYIKEGMLNRNVPLTLNKRSMGLCFELLEVRVH